MFITSLNKDHHKKAYARYDFYAPGVFWFVSSPELKIQTEMERLPRNTRVSFNVGVALSGTLFRDHKLEVRISSRRLRDDPTQKDPRGLPSNAPAVWANFEVYLGLPLQLS